MVIPIVYQGRTTEPACQYFCPLTWMDSANLNNGELVMLCGSPANSQNSAAYFSDPVLSPALSKFSSQAQVIIKCEMRLPMPKGAGAPSASVITLICSEVRQSLTDKWASFTKHGYLYQSSITFSAGAHLTCFKDRIGVYV